MKCSIQGATDHEEHGDEAVVEATAACVHEHITTHQCCLECWVEAALHVQRGTLDCMDCKRGKTYHRCPVTFIERRNLTERDVLAEMDGAMA